MKAMNVAQYNQGWEIKWDDMKRYGPFSRHLRGLIHSLIKDLSFETVLDVGCGQGAFLAELCDYYPHIKPNGIELSSSGIKLAKSRIRDGHFCVLDVTKDYLNAKFDLVICSEVLEHIPDDVAAIRNLARMTKKYLVVSTPQGRMRPYEVETVGHVRNYAYGELARKLEQCGLRVIRTIEWGFPFYSPLYRDFLNLTSGKGTTGEYGAGRKLLASAIYSLFALNSWNRGDEIVVLAEPAA